MLTTICPYCGAVSNHQTRVGHGTDVPGNRDGSMCAGCGEIAVFDFTLPANVRKPTDDERAILAELPEVRQAALIIALRDMQ
jgi:hypothetical protein